MSTTTLLMNQARAAQARSDFAAAARGYEDVLRIEPRNFEAAYAYAVACYQAGELERAAAGFAAAAEINAHQVEPHKDRGLVLMKLGQHDAAREAFEAAVRLRPGSPELLLNLGLARKNSGLLAESVESYEAALRLKPGFAEAHNNLANSLSLLGRHDEALAAATRAVAASPTFARARLTRAGILEELGRASEALEDYTHALALEPRNTEALLAKARLLSAAGRHPEAIGLYDLAIAADPRNARAYDRIGRALEAQGELAAAALSYGKAAELDPAWYSPLIRQAGALAQLGRHEDALAACRKAAAMRPEAPDAILGMADALRSLRRQEEALACYDRLVALSPGRSSFRSARGALKVEMGQQGEGLDDIGSALKITAGGHRAAEATAEACIRLLSVDKIPAIYRSEAELAATRAHVEAVLDGLLQTLEDQPPPGPEQLRVAGQAVRHLTGFYLAYHQRNDRETMRKLSLAATRLLQPGPFTPQGRPAGSGRIRIGIASQRLRDHNGANWAYNWFAQLPRDDYDIFTYSFEASKDPLAAQFAALGTHRALSLRSNPQDIVTQMRGDDLDLLMLPDVGMTAVSRYLSLHRIAPCQFTAWGHPVTTGSPEIDCYLSSSLMEPDDAGDHYTEQLVRMPNLALYLEEAEAPPAAAPAAFGLPEGRVLYGCLQSLHKYLPRHDDILPLIAARVPAALFVFLEAAKPYITAVMRQRLEKAFAARGLDAARHVVFLPRQSPHGYDRLMQAMDVLVDSVGWSGGNTTLSAIFLGIPLATREGRFMRGRHSSAMFRMIGAEEFITCADEDYVSTLVALGLDKARRRHCSDLFLEGRHRLYRDRTFSRAFDGFLKSKAGART